MWTGLIWLRIGPVVGSFEHGSIMVVWRVKDVRNSIQLTLSLISKIKEYLTVTRIYVYTYIF
jgi:hypothetical protein